MFRIIKTGRDLNGNRLMLGINYNYLKFTSGDEYFFEDDDEKYIIINEKIEPNMFIRKLVSRMPRGVKNRLIFLEPFLNDEIDKGTYSEEEYDEYFNEFMPKFFIAIIREIRLRFIFRKLLVAYRTWKMNKTSLKELDPITLTLPEKEVNIYDWNNKKKFILDARSLANLIESKLKYQEYGFATPLMPKNPSTNVEFSYAQLVSIYFQLQSLGELQWGLTTLRQLNFHRNRWFLYHKPALTIMAIQNSILLLDTQDGRELLEDFIVGKMEDLGYTVNENILYTLRKAIVRVPKHWYLEECKSIAILYYESQHFHINKDNIINARCSQLFKKQRKFFKDLALKKII